jgi:prepilin-type processing-associated H-X9-DG protein
MPTDQKGGAVQGVYGDLLGRNTGDANGLIGLLQPADQMSTDQMPTDQRGGYVQGAYGDLLGRDTGDGRAAGGLTKAGPGTLTLGSLNSLKSTDQLFANSRGGDQGPRHVGGMNVALGDGSVRGSHSGGDGSVVPTDQLSTGTDGGSGLLLPAVQKVREAAARSNGASVPDAPERGALNFANPGAAKGLNFTNPGAAKGLNFANNGNNAGGGPHVSPGALKGLNFANTAKK